jgi:hypothetical protein
MASTRNKNTPINYKLETERYQTAHRNLMYVHSSQGAAYDPKWAGNGLNPGKMSLNEMSSNSSDIESFLLGINSTNLVNPAGRLHPDLYCISSADLFVKEPVYMPDPMIVERGQRPTIP